MAKNTGAGRRIGSLVDEGCPARNNSRVDHDCQCALAPGHITPELLHRCHCGNTWANHTFYWASPEMAQGDWA